MTGLAVDLSEAKGPSAAEAVVLAPEAFTTLAAAEAVWRELEAGPAVVMTPYQRFDFAAAYMTTIGRAEAASPFVAVLRDPLGRVRLLLPFAVRRELGLTVARVIGGPHANFHMPIFATREAAGLPHGTIVAALRRLGRVAGIDAFAFAHQPRIWDGTANPLAVGGTPSASDAYGMRLDGDAEATIRRLFSGDARRKLRQKEKWLVDAHGPVTHRVAATPVEAEAILAAYLTQKAARFAQLGLSDPFAGPAARDFLTASCLPSPAGPAPFELHALMAQADGRVLATFIGVADGRRFSGMLTSFDPDPAFARFSPGDLLLHRLIRDQAARGRLALDLGVGEAHYKAKICEETIALVDGLVPVSPRGRLLAIGGRLAVTVKRRIKRNPRLRFLAESLRGAAAGRVRIFSNR
ncbi:GNAT family N-acetyltransferase [Methylobacterium sp. ID0610]|uniref:GNAT family N-acetyltransferase n=1 Tax=Methylobacterium carpenticola TaxID=3344827 RepID=UPI0036AD3740